MIAFHDCWHAFGVHFLTAKVLLTDNGANPKLVDTMTLLTKMDRVNIMQRAGNIVFIVYRFLFGRLGTIKMDLFGDTVGRFKHK